MKRIVCWLVAGAVLANAPALYAGAACCAAKKEAKTEVKDTKTSDCGDILSKLNLTEEQKKKVETLKAECDKGGCNEETQAKFLKGLKEILTADQIAQCKTECEKANKTACPLGKSDSKI